MDYSAAPTPTSSPRRYIDSIPLDKILSWTPSDIWVWATTDHGVRSMNPIAFKNCFDVLVHQHGWLFWRLREKRRPRKNYGNGGGNDEIQNSTDEICSRGGKFDSIISYKPIAFSDPNRIFGPRMPDPSLDPKSVWAMPTHWIRSDGSMVLYTLLGDKCDKWPVRRSFVKKMRTCYHTDKGTHNDGNNADIRSTSDSGFSKVFRRMVVREIWRNAGLFSLGPSETIISTTSLNLPRSTRFDPEEESQTTTTTTAEKDGMSKTRRKSLIGSLRKAKPRRKKSVEKTLTLSLTMPLHSSSSFSSCTSSSSSSSTAITALTIYSLASQKIRKGSPESTLQQNDTMCI